MTVHSLPPEYAPDTPAFDHQLESLSMGWKREFFGYLLEMGLGKSRVLIDDFCLNYQLGHLDALLVIAPKSVYTNWSRVSEEAPGEFQKWMWKSVAEGCITHTYRAGKSKQDALLRTAVLDVTAPGPRVLVINIEAISSTDEAVDFCTKFLRSHRTMIAVDESTVIKDRTSKRTKKITLLGKLATKRRILTGSPSTGSPTDVWGQFEFLKKGCLEHTTFRSFQARYCLLRDMRIGPRVIQKEYGTQNLEELRDLLKKHSIRKRKSQCLDLPPKLYEREMVELTDEQRDAYKEMKRSAMLILGDHEVTTTIVMTQLMRLHQIALGHVYTDSGQTLRLRSNRADAVLDVISRSGEKKVVIWCAYREDADIMTEALRQSRFGNYGISRWTGAEKQEDREAGEVAFQNDPNTRFMIATQSAGGRGRTWTAATLVIYYSNNYDLEMREQSEDRTHRIGQTGAVTYVDMFAPGTVEEKIVNALRNKKNVSRAVQEDGVSEWI